MLTDRVKESRRIINTIMNNFTFKNLIILIVAVLVVYHTSSSIYTSTYVWQSTTLKDLLFKPTRNICLYHTNIQSFQNKERLLNLKIAVLMLYDNKDGNWDKKVMNKVILNRRQYCNRYGYELIDANHLIDKSRPTAWSKLIAIKTYLSTNKFDYIMYIDMDAIIMNMDLKIDSFINSPSCDIIATSDWGGINTGVWIAKNSEWTKHFLQLAWEQKQLLSKYSANNRKHPFEYEQRAFHYLLNTKKWSERLLPLYPGNSSEIRTHFCELPQCSFNSYSMHPFDLRGNRQGVDYVEGDMLIHLAGKKGKMRTNLLNYYLNIAEETAMP